MLSFVVFLWGSSFTLLKLGLEEIPPVTLALLRFAIALPLLAAFAYSQDRSDSSVQILQGWRVFAMLGLTGVTLYHVFQNFGLQLTTASHSSLIISANPVFTALLDHFYLKERLTLRRALGVTLAFLGVVVIIKPVEWSLNPLGVIGDLLSLGAALCWALYSVIGRKSLANFGSSKVTLFSTALGTLFLLPGVLVLETPSLPTSAWLWLLLLVLSLLCSGLAYLFWIKALEDASTTEAGVFLFFLPVVSVSGAHLALLEPLNLLFALGALFIMVGVILTELG
jgi:drug/metabolite transporter (DMT)-like permease